MAAADDTMNLSVERDMKSNRTSAVSHKFQMMEAMHTFFTTLMHAHFLENHVCNFSINKKKKLQTIAAQLCNKICKKNHKNLRYDSGKARFKKV